MLLPLLGVCIGLIIGYILPPINIPVVYTRYIAVAFLAGLDTVTGAWRAGLENNFCLSTFILGFTTNTALAALLTYTGDKMGVDFYLAVIVTFGVRVFTNFAAIRRCLYKLYFSNIK